MKIFIRSRERKGRGKRDCTDSFEKVYWGEIFERRAFTRVEREEKIMDEWIMNKRW